MRGGNLHTRGEGGGRLGSTQFAVGSADLRAM